MSLVAGTQNALNVGLANPQAAADLVTNINTPTPGTTIITSVAATALTVGANGSTNPVFQVDASTASVATGLKVKGAAAASGVAITVSTSGTNEGATFDAAGTGTIKLNSLAGTGAVQIGGAASGVNATGITVTPNSAGSGVAIAAVSTGAAEKLTLDAKGSGALVIGGVSTGLISLGRGSASTVLESGAKTSVGSGNQTATAAQLLTGYITGAQNANTVTLDTGANLDTAIPGVATGDTFYCLYLNTGAGNGTITGASGTNVKGTSAVIPTNGVGLMVFQRTGTGAYDVLVFKN